MNDQTAVVDTVTKLSDEHRDRVLVGASHCGIYAAYLAAKAGVRALILTNAGVGLEDAGIGGLAWGENRGLAVATADHMSCRIADGADVLAHGIISHVNETAAGLGCAPGMSVTDCAAKMHAAPVSTQAPPDYGESRFFIEPTDDLTGDQAEIIGCDSISLLLPEDAVRFAVTASHGALLGWREDDGAVGMDVAGITFSDAGIGKDEAGVARLPVLDKRGIPAAAVDAQTGRIGDARSNWETGVLSRVNASARSLGVEPGMTVQEFAKVVRERS